MKQKNDKYRYIKLIILLAAGLLLGLAVSACSSSGGGGGTPIEILPTVVFLADKQTDGTDELYASFDAGADIDKLSGAMTGGGNVVDFRISPNGLRVAYVADQRTDGVFELFVTTIDGGTPPTTPVSGTMAGSGIAPDSDNPGRYAFAWSSDSSRVAYRADQFIAGVIELFTVISNGSDNVKLHPDFIAGQNVDTFSWAPDGSRVAYLANQDDVDAVELYTSLPTGLGNLRVSGDLVDDGNVNNFLWAPNSDWIAYLADQTTVDQFELFVTQPDQNTPEQVSFPLTALGDVRSDFDWAPDSSRLAYRADFVDDVTFGTDKLGVFTVTSAGTEAIRVSGGVIPGDATGVVAFQWAPDSSLIIYVSDQNVADQFDLFVTTSDIATPLFVKISEFAVAGGDVTNAAWSPDSIGIAYIADQNALDRLELFSAFRTGAGLPRLVSDLGLSSSDVEKFAWSPDSDLIGFRADQDIDNVIELYTAPPNGSVNYTISNTALTGGQVQQFLWEPSGAGIGFIADQDTGGKFELYLSLPDGRDSGKVSGSLVPGGDVIRFAWLP